MELFVILGAIWALSIWWLLPIGALTFLFLYSVFDEEGVFCTASFLALFAALLYNIEPLYILVTSNPISLLSLLGCYMFIGIIWSMFKWYKFLVKEKARGVKGAPKANSYKSEILFWATYWPFGMVKYLIGDLIHDLFSQIWKRIGGVYQKISDKVFE